MKKRCLIMCFVMICEANTWAQTHDFKCDDLYYKITSETTVAVASQYSFGSTTNYWNLIEANIPEKVIHDGTEYTVTSVNEYAFQLCRSLTTVTIPNTVTDIGNNAFQSCIYLTSITIPLSVTSIGNNVFNKCTSLTSITIPNSVTSIGNEVFRGCSNLTSITIPYSVTYLGGRAFYQCSNLTSITIPNQITSIKSNTFTECSNLNKAIIGSAVESISKDAFEKCDQLVYVACLPTIPPTLNEDPFTMLETIYVPVDAVEAYKNAEIWNTKNILPFNVVYAKSSNDSFGIVQGDSILFGGNSLTITAIPKEGYHFVKWSDENMDNPRVCSIAIDTSFTAIFEAHTAVPDAAVTATCTATGLTEGSHCSVCGKVIVAQNEIPMGEHTAVVDAAIAATATETGLTEGSHCSVCGTVLVAQVVIPALGEQSGGNENQGGNNTNPATAVSESDASAVNIYTVGNSIVVENATEEIRVFNAMGGLVATSNDVNAKIGINGSGVYIVKVGGVVKRVVVK